MSRLGQRSLPRACVRLEAILQADTGALASRTGHAASGPRTRPLSAYSSKYSPPYK